jgi:ABC-2 type transport system permease protein
MRGDLAAAMLYRPALLHLDEPTVGLDVVARQRIRAAGPSPKSPSSTGIRSMGHAVHGVLSGQLWAIDHVVRKGEFDRYLLRPVIPLLQLMTRRFQITAVGDLIFGVIVIAITAVIAPIAWSPISITFLIAAVIGSALTESAVMITIGSLTFRLLASSPLLSVVDTVFVIFGPHPLCVLPRASPTC